MSMQCFSNYIVGIVVEENSPKVSFSYSWLIMFLFLLQEAARDALNAEEAARTALEASLDAERQQESRNFFQDLSVFDDNFGGNNFGGNFGGNVFGRRGGRNNIFGGRGLFNF